MSWIKRFFRNPVKTVVDTVVDVGKAVIDFTVDVVGEVISWFIDIPDVPDADQQARSALANKESTIAAIPVIYGTRRVGGIRVFVETSGSDNKFLYMAIVLCEGEINSIGEIYINDEPLTGSKYAPYVTVDKKLGTDNQTASSVLTPAPSWGANDRLQGLAYLGIRLEFNADVFSSVPQITAEVQGRKVFDPRTSTTAFSSNPALCLRDYLTNTRYGKGLPTTLIDDTTFSSAANSCDVDVATYTGSGQTVKKFSCNAVIDTDQTLFNNVKVFLSGMQGMMPYQDGTYKLLIEDDKDSTFSFTIDKILSGIQIAGATKDRKYNRVTAKYINPAMNYQADAVIWPDSGSADEIAFLAEDNNVVLENEINLTTVTNYYQARNIAKTLCLASRKSSLRVSFNATSEALECAVGDIVTVTHPTPAWENKEFRVASLSINYDATVAVSLVEHVASVYPWIEDKEEPESSVSNLPDPLTVGVPSVTVSDELRTFNEEAVTFLIVDVATGDQFVERFEVQTRLEGTTEWVNIAQAAGARFEQVNVEDDRIYEVRARAINTLGVKSAFNTVSHQVVGKTAPPSDVTGLTGNLIGNQYFLTWEAVPDLDLSYYRVRFAAEDTSPTYQNSISLIPKVSRPATSVFVPARNGTYFVKAVDKLGLASETPATIVLSSNIDELDNFSAVQTINEHPDFNGSFDDVVELDEEDRLVLDTSLNFDAVTGNFDDARGLFDGGSGNVDASGFYYFANSADLGAVYLVRATSVIKHVRRDYVTLFDSAEGLFDNREGTFDGDVNAFDNVDVQVEFRSTQDDPASSPTWSEWQNFTVTDVKARGLEFRAKLITTDNQASPAVSFLQVQLDMGERTESGDDIVSGAGAKVVTFNKPFVFTPAIGIGAQDLQTGDYYTLSSKSRTGFTITFYDSTDSAVSRTFDYVAKGTGREVT